MAPSKRKQSAEVAPRKAKAPRSESKQAVAPVEEATPTLDVPAAHKPVLELLDQAMELECLVPSSRAMLQAAMPTLFLKPMEERHDFEKKVIDLFEGIFSDAEAKLTGKVDSAETKLKEVEASKEASTVLRDELAAKIASKQEDKEATGTALQAAIASVDSMQEDLNAELVKEKATEAELKGIEADKERFDVAGKDLQTFVKDVDSTAKAVRARNKEIDRFMETFQELPVDKSLCDGLATGLKAKPSLRGKFTTAVVEHSEKAIQDHLVALDEKLSACRNVSSEREAAVAQARSKFEAAVTDKEQLENMVKTKTQEAAELQRQHEEAGVSIESSGTQSAVCAEELAAHRACLDNFYSLRLSFGSLRDGPAPAEAPVTAMAPDAVPVAEQVEGGPIDAMVVDLAIAAH